MNFNIPGICEIQHEIIHNYFYEMVPINNNYQCKHWKKSQISGIKTAGNLQEISNEIY